MIAHCPALSAIAKRHNETNHGRDITFPLFLGGLTVFSGEKVSECDCVINTAKTHQLDYTATLTKEHSNEKRTRERTLVIVVLTPTRIDGFTVTYRRKCRGVDMTRRTCLQWGEVNPTLGLLASYRRLKLLSHGHVTTHDRSQGLTVSSAVRRSQHLSKCLILPLNRRGIAGAIL